MSEHPVKGISVIIPNYNGMSLLPQILPPLNDALSETGIPFEVIVSDDCSTDGSIKYLRSNHPGIRILTSDLNRGFSPTINKGIFASRHTHLLLLNSDVKLTPGFFSKLFRYFERADTFGVMTRIVGWNDDAIQDGGKYPYFHGVKIKTSGNYVPLNSSEGDWLYSMYLSGANAFVDREKIIALGAFDELFAPFYVEDFELSVRAWRLGWKCYYEHGAICRHKTSSSIKTKAAKHRIKEVYNRNKMFLHALHLPGHLRFVWQLQLAFELIGNLFLLRSYFLRAVWQYMKNRGALRQRRRQFEALAHGIDARVLPLKEVVNLVLLNIRTVPIVRIK